MNSKYQTVVPAYGRDYNSKKAVLDDWNANKDFRCEPEGCYINKADANEYGLTMCIRYKKLTQQIVIKPMSNKCDDRNEDEWLPSETRHNRNTYMV
jgi:hypothetical protein